MSDKTVSVGLRIDGDANGAQQAIDVVEKGLQGLSAEGQKTKSRTDALNASFSKLGIRTAAQIEADILAINQELIRLAQRTDLVGSEFDRAFSAAQERIAALLAELNGVPEDIDHLSSKLADMMKDLAVSFSGAELAHEFVTVNIELENIKRSFIAITGSTAKANQEMEYAAGVANRLGVDVLSTARSYSDLIAATKGTSVEGEVTRKVFESVTRAMAVAGRTSDETAGALNALSQMASKGVVQMEELRGQLGDRLPGALGATAEGLGITTAQLIKLVESGQMTAEELFPALAAGLEKLYEKAAPTETMSQRWAHFKNGIVETFGAVADTGVWATLSVILGGVTEAVMWLATGVTTLTAGLFAFVKVLGVTSAAILSLDFSHMNESLVEISNEMVGTIKRVASLIPSLKSTAEEMDKNAVSTDKAKDATAEHNKTLAQLKSGYSFATEAAAEATKQTQENVEAKKAEADASLDTANAFGTEIQKLIAKADATRVAAAGSAELSERRTEELAIARAHLTAVKEEVAAAGGASESQQKVIDSLQKSVEARQADADKAKAQAQSSAVVAAKAEVEANSHADNSKRIGELKAAYEQAALAADVLRAQKSAGVDVGNALADADLRAGKAAALYRDAINDQAAAIRQNLSLKESQIGVEQAGIRLAIEQQRTIMEVARAKGDEYGATQALLEIKRLEIKLAELTAQAKRAEAEAAMLVAQAKREELMASGQLTPAKEAELKAAEAGAKVKMVESQIAGETAKRMRELADAFQQAGGAAQGSTRQIEGIGKAAERSVPGVDKLTDSMNKLSSARAGGGGGQVGALESSSQDAGQSDNSKGFLDGGHQGDGKIDISAMMYRKGASPEDVKAAQKYFGELYSREASTLLNGNMMSTGFANMRTKIAMNNAIEKSLEYAKQENATGKAVDLGRSASDIQAQKMATADFSKDYSNYSGVKHLQRIISSSAMDAKAQVPEKTIRVKFDTGNGRGAELTANSESQVNDFLRVIQRAGMVASK